MPTAFKLPFQDNPGFTKFLSYLATVLFISLVLYSIKVYLAQPSPAKHNAEIKLVKNKLRNLMAGCRLYWRDEGNDLPCSIPKLKVYGFRPDAMIEVTIPKPYRNDFIALATHIGSRVQFKIEGNEISGAMTQIINDNVQ